MMTSTPKGGNSNLKYFNKWKNGIHDGHREEKWNTLSGDHFEFPLFHLSIIPSLQRSITVRILRLSLFAVIFLLLLSESSFAQFHISGFVTDKLTGERLIGANVVEAGTSNGTSTDNNGYFSLITKGKSIQISFIGYKISTVHFSSDTLVNVPLEGGLELEEITVKGKQSKQFNISTLTHQEMLNIPSLGGKPDVLKALQLLPGIQSQQEGSSLLNVRGGNPGENLYLIDNVPLIYVNHLGGFMSVFNPDMINKIEVYKGGFPAKYGGKLSSIVAITQREGDKSKLKGSLGIGVTDVSFCIEGPLLKKKASFIVTGRKTLFDYFMLAASGLLDGNDLFVMYGFHDINGKFSFHPNNKNSFYINVYQGDDYLKFWNKDHEITNEKFTLHNSWGNWLASARWNRVVSPRLFFDNTVSCTHYRLNILNSYYSKTTNDTINYKNDYYSSVLDLSLRSDWQYKLMKNWSFDFGAKATYYNHIPNKISQTGQAENSSYERMSANELSFYQNNWFKLFDVIDGDVGARLVNYNSGNFHELVVEPRVLLNVRISSSQTLNFTFQRMTQFSHLVFTSGSIFNNEIWIPADKNIAPSKSTQYSLGWKGSFFDGTFETEANVYYKDMNQLASYKEGYSNLMGDGSWRTKIETGGSGKAKGVELLIKKVKGDWTGFVGYTYSNTTRQYPGFNKGEEYLFDYDRPHSLSINLNRKINEKWSFSASWVFQTGLLYTPVIGRQLTQVPNPSDNEEVEYQEAFIYGERNSARMKNYHRLDLGFTLTTKTHWGRKAIWNFSVYNVYNRHNPAAYYYGYSKDGFVGYNPENYTSLKQYQISYFPIIPTVSYKVFFEADPIRKEKRERMGLKQRITNYFNYKYE
jgi:outer membrane receptor protein involved in Fe transport